MRWQAPVDCLYNFCRAPTNGRLHFLAPIVMPALERPVTKPRPVYLNLVRIRLPLPGIVSFLHRVSGAGLFLVGLPLLLAGVQASLASPEAFERFRSAWSNPLAKLVLIGLAWAYLHHLCAGIRFLFLDVHRGIELKPARQSSVAVLIISLVLTLLVGVRLW
jgi:succinate dehydrogenase / fumarate reductase cytochrome b subunit